MSLIGFTSHFFSISLLNVQFLFLCHLLLTSRFFFYFFSFLSFSLSSLLSFFFVLSFNIHILYRYWHLSHSCAFFFLSFFLSNEHSFLSFYSLVITAIFWRITLVFPSWHIVAKLTFIFGIFFLLQLIIWVAYFPNLFFFYSTKK